MSPGCPGMFPSPFRQRESAKPTQGDMFGNRPSSGFCRRNMGIINHILGLLHSGDRELEDIFWSWINRVPVSQVKLPEPAWL